MLIRVRAHVDLDLESYVCISEQCSAPLKFFTRRRDWMDHMQTRHTIHWTQRIHTEQWHCDIGHSDPQTFDEKVEFVSHLEVEHEDQLSSSQRQGRVRRNKTVATRDVLVCPLCNCVPDEHKHLILERPWKLLWKHIGQHLKNLSFYSLSYLDMDLGDGRSGSRSDGVKESKEKEFDVSLHSGGVLEDGAFEDIPRTEVLADGRCRVEGQDFSQESLLDEAHSEFWSFLRPKKLETDWIRLAAGLGQNLHQEEERYMCACGRKTTRYSNHLRHMEACDGRHYGGLTGNYICVCGEEGGDYNLHRKHIRFCTKGRLRSVLSDASSVDTGGLWK